MDYLLTISEQYQQKILENVPSLVKAALVKKNYPKLFFHNKEMHCFQVHVEGDCISANSNYFIGVDWLEVNKAAIYIEPKLNKEPQINFLGMLMQSLEAPENLDHLQGLFHAEFDQPWIIIPEQKDLLSPLLIVQFLKNVQKIVQKGLKKSYYRVTENLDSRIKGKILVGRQIKENLVKNRLTKTICNYQEFGINTAENQFLKLVLKFVASYLNNQNHFFTKEQKDQLNHLLHYCTPAFEHVEVLKNKHQQIHSLKNVFYREYEEAIKVGGYILKRFSFNINKVSQSHTATPPFWIDMSKLFELYVYGQLKKEFPDHGDISYHDPFKGGKETDILVRKKGYQCVIDCKYKPQYINNTPSLKDKRQLAGYTRLVSVYKTLQIPETQIVKGLIIFSHQNCPKQMKKEDLFKDEIGEYVDFYKLGVCLPEI